MVGFRGREAGKRGPPRPDGTWVSAFSRPWVTPGMMFGSPENNLNNHNNQRLFSEVLNPRHCTHGLIRMNHPIWLMKPIIFFFFLRLFTYFIFWSWCILVTAGGLSLVMTSRGPLLITLPELLIAGASLVARHRFQVGCSSFKA